jgi:hypothetical protein
MITASDLVSKAQIYLNSISTRVEASDWYEFFSESIRKLRRGRTFPWQRRQQDFEFFTDVFQYPLPIDFDSFIKPNDRMFEKSSDGPWLIYGRDKDFFANQNYGLALSWNAEVLSLLARINGQSDLKIDGFEDDITNYTAANDTANLYANINDFKEGSGSLQFDIVNVLGTAIIKRTYTDPFDITDFIKQNGSAFCDIYLPVAITSLGLQIGTDASNYYEVTGITTDFLGQSLSAGWHKIQFKLATKTTILTPDTTKTYFIQATLTHGGISATGFLIDGLFLRLGKKMEMPYNSKYVVKSDLGVYQERILLATDQILGDTTFESVVMWKGLEYAGFFKYTDQDIVAMAKENYKEDLIDFNRRYPSTEAPLQSNYYKRFNSF